jgi:alpha-tubulin suppressor-like RCC1 family protein
MLAVNEIITKINTLLSSGSLSQLQVTQLSAAVQSIEERGVSTVATATDLPNPVTNVGRFFYIVDEAKYTFSNGTEWGIEGTIAPAPVNAYAWGSNGQGQLGDGTTVTKSSPVSVVGNFTDWVQVISGGAHSLGIRADGTAWAWGNGGQGRLGNNSTVTTSSPISVVGGFTDWVQLFATGQVSLGVRADGTAWAWGSNGNGQLGDNSITTRSSPVSIVGGFTDWVQLSSGGSHSLGVRANGTAWAWGFGSVGQLGDGTTVSKRSPVSVVGGFTDWVQVSGGSASFSLGLRANGTAWGWGINTTGMLGDGTTVNKSSPVSVVGGFTDWTQVSAGSQHSLGLRANGTAWAWGNNGNGRFGDDALTNRSSPVSVVGGFTDWTQVSAGSQHSLGLRANGTAWGWGINTTGMLGDGTTVSKRSPVSVIGGFTDWVQVNAGSDHSSGIRG